MRYNFRWVFVLVCPGNPKSRRNVRTNKTSRVWTLETQSSLGHLTGAWGRRLSDDCPEFIPWKSCWSVRGARILLFYILEKQSYYCIYPNQDRQARRISPRQIWKETRAGHISSPFCATRDLSLSRRSWLLLFRKDLSFAAPAQNRRKVFKEYLAKIASRIGLLLQVSVVTSAAFLAFALDFKVKFCPTWAEMDKKPAIFSRVRRYFTVLATTAEVCVFGEIYFSSIPTNPNRLTSRRRL